MGANDNHKHKDWDRLMSELPLWSDMWIGSQGWLDIRNPATRDSLIWYFIFQYHFEKTTRELDAELQRGMIRAIS